jgi:hypothetical protein
MLPNKPGIFKFIQIGERMVGIGSIEFSWATGWVQCKRCELLNYFNTLLEHG